MQSLESRIQSLLGGLPFAASSSPEQDDNDKSLDKSGLEGAGGDDSAPPLPMEPAPPLPLEDAPPLPDEPAPPPLPPEPESMQQYINPFQHQYQPMVICVDKFCNGSF